MLFFKCLLALQTTAYVTFREELVNFTSLFSGNNDDPFLGFVPNDALGVQGSWESLKLAACCSIGPQASQYSKEQMVAWASKAATPREMYTAAQARQSDFESLVLSVATTANARASFGPANTSLKEYLSFQRKWRKASCSPTSECEVPENANWKRIDDLLRATIVCSNTSQIADAVEATMTEANRSGYRVFVDNKFDSCNKFGYVGVHATLFSPDSGVLCELQFHLQDIMDGTSACPKEEAHRIYDSLRAVQSDSNDQARTYNAILKQKFLFLFGLSRANSSSSLSDGSTTACTLCKATCPTNSSQMLYNDGSLFRLNVTIGDIRVDITLERYSISSKWGSLVLDVEDFHEWIETAVEFSSLDLFSRSSTTSAAIRLAPSSSSLEPCASCLLLFFFHSALLAMAGLSFL